MLLSARDPAADISKPQEKSYPNILSGFRRRSGAQSVASNTSQRAPLAALDPQSVAHSADGMSSSSSHLIGRRISSARFADEEDTENQKGQTLNVYVFILSNT
jgi:hypothetical protein